MKKQEEGLKLACPDGESREDPLNLGSVSSFDLKAELEKLRALDSESGSHHHRKPSLKEGIKVPMGEFDEKDEDDFEVEREETQNDSPAALDNKNDGPKKTIEEEGEDDQDKLIEALRAKVRVPYLPPLQNGDGYTLVLDLDETLIHYEIEGEEGGDEEDGFYLVRPGAIKFLTELSKYYELVIFTAAIPEVISFIPHPIPSVC